MRDYFNIQAEEDNLHQKMRRVEHNISLHQSAGMDTIEDIRKKAKDVMEKYSENDEIFSFLSERKAKAYLQIKADYLATGFFKTTKDDILAKEAEYYFKNKKEQLEYINFLKNIEQSGIARLKKNKLELQRLQSACTYKDQLAREYLTDINNRKMQHKFSLYEIRKKIQLVKGWFELKKDQSEDKIGIMNVKLEKLRLMKERYLKNYHLDDKEYEVFKEDMRILKTKLYKTRVPYILIQDNNLKNLFALESEWRTYVSQEALENHEKINNRDKFLQQYSEMVEDYIDDWEAMGQINDEHMICPGNSYTFIGNIQSYSDDETIKKVLNKIAELKQTDEENEQLYTHEDGQGALSITMRRDVP